ncbi:MAG: 30S ribosomal protein S16 [Patescibacteria group bacterium]|nr:30S ribosomal protein S16 [Patescibacteria group bacterium]MDE1941124.1 30S ribosomal protein S16 [Patescibacteria group bacterium]MDE1966485.1 30S ribosomal protein S16 [Patescibacteria group bacterium]
MIRLQRTGRKHEPTFRVVLTDSKNGPKSGKYLKNLGWYDPRLKNDASKQLDVASIKKYVKDGAKLSLTLHNFLIRQKVIEGKILNALPKKTVQKPADAGASAAAPAASGAAPAAASDAPAAAPAQAEPSSPADSPKTA